MRKLLLTLSALAVLSCGSKQNEAASEQEPEKVSQEEYLESWIDMGVDNFSFDSEGYLVYTVSRDDVSADPNWVAKQHYDMAADVEGIKGCRVVDTEGEEFGRYEK